MSFLLQKALQRLKPGFTDVHIDGFYQLQYLKNEALKIQDKQESAMFRLLRVEMKVLKFIKILKEKIEMRRRRRLTFGLSADQQAKSAIQRSNSLVNLYQLGFFEKGT